MQRQPTSSASSRPGLELSFRLNVLKQSFVQSRRAPEESPQQLYHDICRLVILAYLSAEASLVTHEGKDAFISALNDSKLQLEVIRHELQNAAYCLYSCRFVRFE